MEWLTRTADWVKTNWFTVEGLGVLLVLASSAAIAFAGALEAPAIWALGLLLFANAAIFAAWLKLRGTPRTRTGKVGFAVAISSEPGTSAIVRTDFIRKLQECLFAGPSADSFHFVVVPEHVATRLVVKDDVERLRRAMRAHFVLAGKIRKRKLADGVDHEILDLQALVAHAPLDVRRAKKLSGEFSELLPRRYQIRADLAFPGIEFTATWAGLIAKYIIGLAAAMSGDLDYGEKLLVDVQARLDTRNQGFLFYAKVRERIPRYLSEIAFVRARAAVAKWYETRNQDDFVALKVHVSAANARKFEGTGWAILRAIEHFCELRRTGEARNALNKVQRKERDAVWHLNMAFLDAYDGDLRSATRHYRKADELGVPSADIDVLIGQVEHFLVWQLELEPAHFEISYCLGYINWFLKGDAVQAVADFRAFLEKCPEGQHATERGLAMAWIEGATASSKDVVA